MLSPPAPTVQHMFAFLVLAALAIGATALVARVATMDKITEPPRRWLIGKLGTDNQLVFGIHCPKCMAVWIAPATAAAPWFAADGANVLGVTSWVGYPLLAATVAFLAAVAVVRGEQ